MIGLTIISLCRMRYTLHRQETTHSFKTPWSILIFNLIVVVFMIVSPFVSSPKVEFLYGLGFVALGGIIYIPFVYMQRQIPGFDKVTTVLQLLLQIAPTAKI